MCAFEKFSAVYYLFQKGIAVQTIANECNLTEGTVYKFLRMLNLMPDQREGVK
jgi:DNA-binding NarL/FixJ family response regulator